MNNLTIEKGVRIVPLSHFWAGKHVHIATGTILIAADNPFAIIRGA
jgi:hypothetical protein